MTVSWDDLVKDAGDVGGYEPLPESDYDMVVKSAKFKPSKTGKKMWEIVAKVESGAYVNRQVWSNLVITPDNPNALAMFFRKMGALGLSIDYFKTNPSDEAVASALTGRRFRAHIGQRTYQGEKRNEIEKWFPAADGSAPPVPGMTGATPPPGAYAPPPVAATAPPAPAPAAPPAPAPVPQAAPPAPVPAPAPAAPQPQFQQPVAPAAAAAPVQDPWTGQPAAPQPAYTEQPTQQAPQYTEQPAAAAPAAPAPEVAAPPAPAPVAEAPAPAPAAAPAPPAPAPAPAAPQGEATPAVPAPPAPPF